MYQQDEKELTRRVLFMTLDLIGLFISYCLCFFIREGHFFWQDRRSAVSLLLIVWGLADIIVFFMNDTLKDVFKRRRKQEFFVAIRHTVILFVFLIAYLFLTKQSSVHSRFTLFVTPVVYLFLSWGFRTLLKYIYAHWKISKSHKNARSVVIISSSSRAAHLIHVLQTESWHYLKINAVCLTDAHGEAEISGVPVLKENIVDYACREWVDEVFMDTGIVLPEISSALYDMGIVVHTLLLEENSAAHPVQVGTLASMTVATSCIKMADWRQLFAKRVLDILGGLVGCFLTGILFLFVAPQIRRQSPGPVFFKQERIGRNGKKFYMYKFRSMYLDADERKKEMLAKNNYSDNLMFKMDDDPRIIGGEKGIGGFIRRTSIDEFPQFFNVLRGDMSLVGTRPPTADEWERYSPHHRSRMAVKPGITGLWQVSGRSSITDFDQVVSFDRQYIETWSVWLDIKLLLKTVGVVLARKGAQ